MEASRPAGEAHWGPRGEPTSSEQEPSCTGRDEVGAWAQGRARATAPSRAPALASLWDPAQQNSRPCSSITPAPEPSGVTAFWGGSGRFFHTQKGSLDPLTITPKAGAVCVSTTPAPSQQRSRKVEPEGPAAPASSRVGIQWPGLEEHPQARSNLPQTLTPTRDAEPAAGVLGSAASSPSLATTGHVARLQPRRQPSSTG